MPRERLCKKCGGWHPLGDWPQECLSAPSAALSDLPTPMVNFDTMDALRSMTNGLYYDSKSALRSEYRRAGVVEVGNDVPTKKPVVDKSAAKKERKEAIGKAMSRVGFGA